MSDFFCYNVVPESALRSHVKETSQLLCIDDLA